jgi:hypothetical protein
MILAIYRSRTHLTYPEECLIYSYALHPIHAADQERDGHLTCWTDDSGLEPFVVIEAPEGSRVAEQEDGWQLFVPERPTAIDAEVVYELAKDQVYGLSVVRGPKVPC